MLDAQGEAGKALREDCDAGSVLEMALQAVKCLVLRDNRIEMEYLSLCDRDCS